MSNPIRKTKTKMVKIWRSSKEDQESGMTFKSRFATWEMAVGLIITSPLRSKLDSTVHLK